MPYQWNWLDGSRRHLSHISKGTACESIIKLIHTAIGHLEYQRPMNELISVDKTG
jgi:hypothetical protein